MGNYEMNDLYGDIMWYDSRCNFIKIQFLDYSVGLLMRWITYGDCSFDEQFMEHTY